MGMSAALAVFMKQQGAIVLVFALVLFITYLIKNWKQGSSIKNFAFAALGVFTPVILFITSLWYKGAIKPFKYFAVDYAKAYTKIGEPHHDTSTLNLLMGEWEYFLFDTRMALVVVLLLALWHKRSKFTTALHPLFLVLFVAVSYASILPGWYYRPHYYQYIIPALALLMAYAWSWLRTLSEEHHAKPIYASLLMVGLLTSVYIQKDYFFIDSSTKVIDKMYYSEKFNQMREIGRVLKKNKNPNDTMGFMGYDPQVVFYADMVSASGYMYNFPMVENQPYSMEMAEQYKKEILKAKPKWFFDSFHWNNWEWFHTRPPMEDTDKFIRSNYFVRGALYNDDKLEWNMDSIDKKRVPFAIVYERRDVGQEKGSLIKVE
jgi:hypothetical protein